MIFTVYCFHVNRLFEKMDCNRFERVLQEIFFYHSVLYYEELYGVISIRCIQIIPYGGRRSGHNFQFQQTIPFQYLAPT